MRNMPGQLTITIQSRPGFLKLFLVHRDSYPTNNRFTLKLHFIHSTTCNAINAFSITMGIKPNVSLNL